MKKLYTLFSALLFLQISFASQNRKVLIIGIDGTRSDALQKANTPNIDGLLPNSLYSYDSWHTAITWSGPSWATILTGVYFNKHGVVNNGFTGKHFNQYPPISALAKQVKPNLDCAIVAEWDPLIDEIDYANWNRAVKTPDTETWITADSAVAQLQKPNIDLLFAYFDKVDMTGHSSGFDTANQLYIQAIETVDSAVGKVLSALYARPNYSNENWLVFVVTDHGGQSILHGGNTYDQRHIWWIATGNAVAHQKITKADPGTYNCNNNLVFDNLCVDANLMKQSPVHPDVAVTALHHLLYDTLNPETVTAWNLDGKSWLQQSTGIANIASNTQLNIFPNPSSGIFEIDNLQFAVEQKIPVEIYSIDGKTIYTEMPKQAKVKVDLSNIKNGIYFLKVGTITQKIVVE
ncbi:MAG TPA: alkaline phosphatase family protein [Chitinophagales bacterium]|nr:alkaline phosphatase family protein [Chitinophagales bacterium]